MDRAIPILLVLPVLPTAVCIALLHVTGIPRAVRLALGTLVLIGYGVAVYLLAPEDLLTRALLLIALGPAPVLGNFAALIHRLRTGWDGLGAYLVDVPTLCAPRLLRRLRSPAGSPARLLARGLLLGAATVGGTILLRRLAPGDLPAALWLYLKLLAFGLGVQALSDILLGPLGGRIPPFSRMPLLAVSFPDFWGRRWNVWVHGWLFWFAQDILGARRAPLRLVIYAFAVSGVLHEILSTLILREIKGYWLAFWAAQLALTLIDLKLLRGLRRAHTTWLGAVWVQAGFLATAPLFFAVVDRCYNVFGPPVTLWW